MLCRGLVFVKRTQACLDITVILLRTLLSCELEVKVGQRSLFLSVFLIPSPLPLIRELSAGLMRCMNGGQWLPLYMLTQQHILCVNSFPPPPPSLSSNMLTCKTPPHAAPSMQPVKLTVDSVERLAPVPFTFNQDPIINSIQPSRSFIRLVMFNRGGGGQS